MTRFADDVAAILEDAGVSEKVALVGFSMGGGEVARFLTKQGANRVSKAVLISSVVPYMLKTDDNPKGVPQATFDEMTAGMKKDREHFFNGFFKDFYGVGAITSPVSDEVLMNSWRQAMMAGLRPTLAAAQAFATTDFRPDLAELHRADAGDPRHRRQDSADRRHRPRCRGASPGGRADRI